MDISVEFIAQNRQYRIVKMAGEHYVLDVEKSIWPIFIPFLFWFMPQRMFKVNAKTVEKLKMPSGRSNRMGTIMLIGIGVSAVLSQLLKPILDFTIGTTMIVNALLLIITGAIIIILRLYMRRSLRNQLRKTLDMDTLESVTIRVRPKYIKQYFVPILGYLFCLFLLIAVIPLFIETGHFVGLLAFLVFFPFLLISSTAVIHPNLGKINLYRATRVH